MKDSKRLVSFYAYPTLYEETRKKAAISGRSFNEQMELLVSLYCEGELGNVETLRNAYAKEKIIGEKKSTRTAIRIEPTVYSKLLNILAGESTRPSTFFTLAMAYYLNTETSQKVYAEKAVKLLAGSPADIKHVVYGLKYYAPSKSQDAPWMVNTTEYFIDACTEERFNDIYCYHTPIYEVLAVHR